MLHYQIKKTPEDFNVSEVLHLNCDVNVENKFHYYVLAKKGLTTFEAIDTVADHFKLPNKSVGYAGLKDEDAITTQYLSLPSYLGQENLDNFNQRYKENHRFLNLSYYGSGQSPIKVAKLHGNCFQLKIRNLSSSIFKDIQPQSEHFLYFLNYYGSQRFGLPNQCKNTHLIGEAIFEEDYKQARVELAQQNSPIGLAAKTSVDNPKDFIYSIDPKLLAFYQSAYYSYLWNKTLTQHLLAEKLPYNMHTLDDIDFYFPTRPNDELQLLKTIPEIENTRVITDGDFFQKISYKRSTVVQTKVYVNELSSDLFNPGKFELSVSFYLTTGSYATIAIAQFLQQLTKKVELEKNLVVDMLERV